MCLVGDITVELEGLPDAASVVVYEFVYSYKIDLLKFWVSFTSI